MAHSASLAMRTKGTEHSAPPLRLHQREAAGGKRPRWILRSVLAGSSGALAVVAAACGIAVALLLASGTCHSGHVAAFLGVGIVVGVVSDARWR